MSVRFPLSLALVIALAASAFAAPRQTILPAGFAGWQQSAAKSGTDPTAVDAANAALLKEYGFKEYEIAEYKRDGSSLKLRAMRFGDAPGAFGTFCFYAAPQMKDDQIGDHAATAGDHVIFSRANVIVDALFAQPSVMSAAELRELAQELPVAKGGAAAPAEVVGYLPAPSLLPNSIRYVIGPVGLTSVGTALPAQVVDFSRSAEAAVGEYRTRWGTAKLGVIEYPTPQIAADKARGLVQFVSGSKPGEYQGTIVFPSSSGGEIAFRRSGPLLIYVSGASSDEEARSLAQSVNYEASVTWNQAPQMTANGVVKLVVYSLVLALMLIAIFVVLMIFFGGSYVALRKFFPKLKLPAQDNELIKLNLKE